MEGSPALLLPFAIAGLISGLGLLWRGMGGYRTSVAIGDTSTSTTDSLAAGEVRVTGAIEPIEATLVSPLQSRPCVWYHARVRAKDGEGGDVFEEERAVGFRVRDAGGAIRVFPRGARFGVPTRFEASTGFGGELPAGYWPRSGSVFGPAGVEGDRDGDGELDPAEREAAVAALLTVRAAPDTALADAGRHGSGSRSFEEARLEPGDAVTVVGMAVPFGHVPDPFGADRMDRAADPLAGLDDPAVAADVAAAREAGTLLTPEEAWGNAAIPGFGIGRPVFEPELDPAATRPDLAPASTAAETSARFDIAPDTLVLVAMDGVPLRIVAGSPEVAVAREQGAFLFGLLGAVLAVVSAIVAAVAIGGLAS